MLFLHFYPASQRDKTTCDQTTMHPHLRQGRSDQNWPVLSSGNPISLNMQFSTFSSRRWFKQFIPLDSREPPLPCPPSASVGLGSCIRRQSGALWTSTLRTMPHHSKGCYLWKAIQMLKPQPSCLEVLRGVGRLRSLVILHHPLNLQVLKPAPHNGHVHLLFWDAANFGEGSCRKITSVAVYKWANSKTDFLWVKTRYICRSTSLQMLNSNHLLLAITEKNP